MNNLTIDYPTHEYNEDTTKKNSHETDPDNQPSSSALKALPHITINGNSFEDPLKKIALTEKIYSNPQHVSEPGFLTKPNFKASRNISKSLPNAQSFSNCLELYSKTFQSIESHSPQIFYIKKDKKAEKKFVTQKMIDKWNSQIGNTENFQKAENLIRKMRQLGGLDRSDSKIEINIPEARLGLCLLAGYKNQDYKMLALASLLEILKNDQGQEKESNRLVEMAIILLKLLGKENFQTYSTQAQIKFAEVYCALTEILNDHYSKKHINAITTELKKELVNAANAIKLLNRQEDHKIKFYVNCALEGIRRFQDDKQELFIFLRRIYDSAIGAICLYKNNMHDGIERLEKAFRDINMNSKNIWYDAIIIAKHMAYTIEDRDEMTLFLQFIGKKHQEKINWKFTYAAVQILSNLALNGKDKHIRIRAFEGFKSFGLDCPGLAFFAGIDDLEHYTSYKNLKHLKKSEEVNPNVRVRHTCIERLIELLQYSEDDEIKTKAKKILKFRASKENDPDILQMINEALPKKK